MKPALLSAALVCAATAATANAAVIAAYDFSGFTPAPSAVDPRVVASDFQLSSPALGLVGLVFGAPFPSAAANGWDGPAGSRAFQFRITANPGFSLQLSSLSFDNFAVDPPDLILDRNGPQFFDVRVNGVAVSTANPASVNSWEQATIPLHFSGDSALIEIVAYGGTPGIALTAGWAVDNLVLEGQVIPEPALAGTLMGLGLAGFAVARRCSPAARQRYGLEQPTT